MGRALAALVATVVLSGVVLSAATARSVGPPDPAFVGETVLLAKQSQTQDCMLGPNPDRDCSPGAFYKKLTKSVLCSSDFTTKKVRYVPQSMKYRIEGEYGMEKKKYGSSLEIDHIVSLELGGSNEPANLFPEGLYAHPGYKIKDKLENKLHGLVCDGKMTLRTVQRAIAKDWQALYEKVYGTPPG